MKAFCSVCRRDTNHDSLFEKKRRIDDDEMQVSFLDEWQIIQCKGCEDISFRHVSSNSDDYDPEDGTPYEMVRLYPQRSEDVLYIKGYYNAPLSVRGIYRETIDAFNNGLYILCAGGLRATIESICNAEGVVDGPVDKTKVGGPIKIVRVKDLMGKINGLNKKGIITKKQSEILHEHRYLGNNALHLSDAPSKKLLKTAIEIVEHTLYALYEIGDKADELALQRKKKAAKK